MGKQKIFSSLGVFVMILIALTCTLVIFLVTKWHSPAVKNFITNVGRKTVQSISPAELKANYESSGSEIFTKYVKKQQELPLKNSLSAAEQDEWQKSLEGFRDELLALKLPGEYKELHKSLVFAFADMAKNIKGDFSVVEKQELELDSLVLKYPWLIK